MKTRLFALAFALVGLLAFRAVAEKTPVKDLKCPISGKAVNPDAFVEYDGGKVYFCCENCPGAFKKDPAKFAAAAHLQEAESGELMQVACPLTGKKANPDETVMVGTAKVALCCGNCKAAVGKMSDEEKVTKLFTDVSKSYKPASEAGK